MLELGLAAGDTSADEALPAGPDRGRPIPASIGPYRVLEVLGEGGMGTVYLAEQDEPVRRRVALKVVKRGMGTKNVIQRFEAERQALARMEHPSIARVYDAGETAEGLPYFAMEYVEGLPITTHCDRERLTMRQRLELLADVCVAVQHAHRKGVIHRDIKPSNVLVARTDGKAVPKVIDFGVAKAIEQHLTERSVFTELGMIVGTPEYMSPEQAEFTGERVDTRTDVYSLGVLQYELMTGSLPFDSMELRAGGFEQICRRIREEEPAKPSTRVSGAGPAALVSAKQRSVDVPTWRRELSGDLDWVNMRALAKDPERRYGSPQELADELRRYLNHEPVVAGPPSASYRIRKFVRRNRLAVGSATAIALALLAGVVIAAAFGLREAAQRRAADRARSELEKVVDFQARMISDVDAEAMGRRLVDDLRERIEAVGAAAALDGVNGTDAALRMLDEEILERAAVVAATEFAGEPLIEARLRESLANTYRRLGLPAKAGPHAKRTLELRTEALGSEDPATLRALYEHGSQAFIEGRFDEAIAIYLESVSGLTRALGAEHRRTLVARNALGLALIEAGRYDEAETGLLDVLEARRRVLGAEDLQTVDTMERLATLYTRMERPADAEPLVAEALRILERDLGEEDPATLRVRQVYAQTLSDLGRDEAEGAFLATLEIRRRVLGTQHPDVMVTLNNLAAFYLARGRYTEAGPILREALALSEMHNGLDHFATISVSANLASLELESGNPVEAGRWFQSTLRKLERAVGPDHPQTILTRLNLGLAYRAQGRYDEAAQHLAAAASHEYAPLSAKITAATYFGMDTPARDVGLALRLAREAVEETDRAEPGAMALLARTLLSAGRAAEAYSTWAEVVALPGAGAVQFNDYAWFLLTREGSDAADAVEALNYAQQACEMENHGNAVHLDTLALAYHRTNDHLRAIEAAEQAVSLLDPNDTVQLAAFGERLEEYREAAELIPESR